MQPQPTAPYGGFILPAKTGTGWITIQSSNMASLPSAGQRVFPSHAAHMPNIRASSGGDSANRALKTALPPNVAHGYKLIGLEIIGPADNAQMTTLVDLGRSTSDQNSLSLIPYDLVMDRCYLHPNVNTADITNGITLNSKSTDIINCYIEEFHRVGFESHGIIGTNGTGPFNIINNHVEGASINVMFGGGTTYIPGTVPSNILISRNYLIKPLAWQGKGYAVKNHFEIKCGQNITFDSNILDNSWVDGQTGMGISLKVTNYSAWQFSDNITVSNNLVRNCVFGISMLGWDWEHPTTTGRLTNVTIRNNLFAPITNSGTGASFIKGVNNCANTTVDHNTCINTGVGETSAMLFGLPTTPDPWTGFVYKNNMHATGKYVVKADSTTAGDTTINLLTTAPRVFDKNVMMDASPYSQAQLLTWFTTYNGGWSPTSLMFPQSWTGVLVNQANPGTNYAGYKVVGWDQPTNPGLYPYNNTGTDGKDIGCDIDAVVTATAGCISGVWSNPVTVTFKNGVNGYSGATSFMARGDNPTVHYGPSMYHADSNRHPSTSAFTYRTFLKFDLSSIPSGVVIDSATLKVKTENTPGSNVFLNAHRVAPVGGAFTVNYATATRNSPTGTSTNWTIPNSAGGMIADPDNDYLDTPDDSELVAGPAIYNLDVKSSIQAWVTGTPNNGWILAPNQSGSNVVIYMGTPADLNGSGDYPELTITYH